MKKIIFFCSITLLLSCSKSSDSKSENELEIDVSEGQTNWTKNKYTGVTDEVQSIGVNDIVIRGETIIMVGSADYGETAGRVWRSNDSGETWKFSTGGGLTWIIIEDLKDYPNFLKNNGVIASNYFIDNLIGYCNSPSEVFKTTYGGETIGP